MTENQQQQQQVPVDSKYLPELMAEKDSIDPSFVHAVRLISNEIERVKNPEEKSGGGNSNKELVDANDGRPVKQTLLIKVPVDRHPSFNYVGRLLGPGGSTLKGIQSSTSTQIAILGKGSMRDKKKAEELAAGGDAKFHHLNLPLHVRVTSVSSLDQALLNISGAVSELLKLMQPNEDDMVMAQGQSGRGMGHRGGGMRGRGGRGAAGRGGASRGGMRGGRGGASQRGTTGGRGRGASAGGRGGFGSKTQDPYAAASGYDYGMESYEGYGGEYGTEVASYDTSYGSEAYAEAYAAEAGYGDASYGADAYGGYGDGSSYDAYGNGAEASVGQYGSAAQTGSKPFRGKMRGGAGRGRASAKPY